MATCNDCIKLETDNRASLKETKYYCKELHQYKNPNEEQCSYFSYNRESNKKPNDGFTPSGCYITTMVCNILGYEDNCSLLSLLRKFRENVLKCDFRYYQLLIQYDMIGPVLSKAILEKEDNYSYALHMCTDFLLPCASLIKEGMLDGAVEVYKNMVQSLSEDFNIVIPEPKRSANYEINTLGKARILKGNA